MVLATQFLTSWTCGSRDFGVSCCCSPGTPVKSLQQRYFFERERSTAVFCAKGTACPKAGNCPHCGQLWMAWRTRSVGPFPCFVFVLPYRPKIGPTRAYFGRDGHGSLLCRQAPRNASHAPTGLLRSSDLYFLIQRRRFREAYCCRFTSKRDSDGMCLQDVPGQRQRSILRMGKSSRKKASRFRKAFWSCCIWP